MQCLGVYAVVPRTTFLHRDRQLPPARSYILSQRVGLVRRLDPEVPVVRRAPLVHDRQDLDELVPTSEAARCLVAPSACVAVDGKRGEVVTHWSSVERFSRVVELDEVMEVDPAPTGVEQAPAPQVVDRVVTGMTSTLNSRSSHVVCFSRRPWSSLCTDQTHQRQPWPRRSGGASAES